MGRYGPKERKNRGKVTKILWGDAIMIILVCKIREWWGGLLKKGGGVMGHRRQVSRTRVSRARIPCKLALFAFTTFTIEGTTARWVFLRLVIFQCSVRAFLGAFFGLFSPSWDEKQPEMLKCVRKKCVSRCGWGSCNEICEGCESKKCKISVGAHTRTREKGVFRFIYRPLLAVVGGCCHTSMEHGEECLVDFKFISDVWQKTWEIFRKTLEIFCGKFGANGRKVVSVAGAVENAPKPV